jgi:3-hydroxyisobutyrate dehydrogenase-like beta-hydroxyacid dehydrogenase
MAKRVGIVGIGIMGTAMMRNLVKDGFEVVGYCLLSRRGQPRPSASR